MLSEKMIIKCGAMMQPMQKVNVNKQFSIMLMYVLKCLSLFYVSINCCILTLSLHFKYTF